MTAELREFIRARANNRCEYCLLPHDAQRLPFHVEHIIARQHGGDDGQMNLAWACDRCNAYKGPNLSSIDPECGKTIELFNPRVDKWSDHFLLQDAHIVGISQTGRATVRLLQMNSRRRVDVRRELIAEDLFGKDSSI